MLNNNHNNNSSLIDRLLARIFQISVIVFVAFYIIFILGNKLLQIDNINFLGFFGSIVGGVLGGILTLFGVIKTINREQQNKFVEEFSTKLKYFKQLNVEIEYFHNVEFRKLVENDHVQRVIIEEYEIIRSINEKFEKIKEVAANIDAYTYYILEN